VTSSCHREPVRVQTFTACCSPRLAIGSRCPFHVLFWPALDLSPLLFPACSLVSQCRARLHPLVSPQPVLVRVDPSATPRFLPLQTFPAHLLFSLLLVEDVCTQDLSHIALSMPQYTVPYLAKWAGRAPNACMAELAVLKVSSIIKSQHNPNTECTRFWPSRLSLSPTFPLVNPLSLVFVRVCLHRYTLRRPGLLSVHTPLTGFAFWQLLTANWMTLYALIHPSPFSLLHCISPIYPHPRAEGKVPVSVLPLKPFSSPLASLHHPRPRSTQTRLRLQTEPCGLRLDLSGCVLRQTRLGFRSPCLQL
ncbi:hypothetical protein LXA43DRAFT_541807, partial [Ganoderma leucocontextum]